MLAHQWLTDRAAIELFGKAVAKVAAAAGELTAMTNEKASA